jgi:hypothetical protein
MYAQGVCTVRGFTVWDTELSKIWSSEENIGLITKKNFNLIQVNLLYASFVSYCTKKLVIVSWFLLVNT